MSFAPSVLAVGMWELQVSGAWEKIDLNAARHPLSSVRQEWRSTTRGKEPKGVGGVESGINEAADEGIRVQPQAHTRQGLTNVRAKPRDP